MGYVCAWGWLHTCQSTCVEVTGYFAAPSFRNGIQVGRQGAGNAFSSAFFIYRGLPSQITLPGNALMDLPADASLVGSSPSWLNIKDRLRVKNSPAGWHGGLPALGSWSMCTALMLTSTPRFFSLPIRTEGHWLSRNLPGFQHQIGTAEASGFVGWTASVLSFPSVQMATVRPPSPYGVSHSNESLWFLFDYLLYLFIFGLSSHGFSVPWNLLCRSG